MQMKRLPTKHSQCRWDTRRTGVD